MTLDSYTQMITNVLKQVFTDSGATQLADSDGRVWAIPTKRSVLFVRVDEMEGHPALRFTCPILFMPPQDLLPFYRKLLDLNTNLIDVSLGMDRDQVVVISRQLLEGLTEDAIAYLMRRAMNAADVLAEVVLQEFNSSRQWRPK
jgi:hypothetical protein